MHICKEDLLITASQVGIEKQKAEELWEQLSAKPTPTNKFDLPHLFYYLGALIAILAMGWFIGKGFEKLEGIGILTISLLYFGIYTLIGSVLWNKEHLRVPGGVFITLAVFLTPLIIYGFELYVGWWVGEAPGSYQYFYQWISGGWFFMEVATILVGVIMLYFFRFPLITMPIFFTLWFMSMDITPLIFGDRSSWNGNEPLWVSLWFGLIILLTAYFVDQKTRYDFAFWGYLFGMLSFWFGLSFLDRNSEVERFIYLIINIVLVLFSILLQRTVFLIFGVIGILSYIGTLAYLYFSDSTLFPLVLSGIGILIIFLGVIYSKKRTQIEKRVMEALPLQILRLIPKSRRSDK